MKKHFLAFLLIVTSFVLSFTGCTSNPSEEIIDEPIIVDGVVKVGLLLSNDDTYTNISEQIKNGFDYGHSLADNLNIGKSIKVETLYEAYTDSTDVLTSATNLHSAGASAIVTDGTDISVLTIVSNYFSNKNIPVINLSNYSCKSDVVFNLALSTEYIASSAATHAMDKGYTQCAVLAEEDSDYFKGFAEIYSSTLNAYIGTTPTIYYKSGESANYTPSALTSGNYDYLFLITTEKNRQLLVEELRSSGFSGEIMLTEITDKTTVQHQSFNNCSFFSKLELDSANNISTVFHTSYSEFKSINEHDISAASAYGYDSYMVLFEALKSFGGNKNSAIIFSNSTEPSENIQTDEILGSDLITSINNLTYYGVTDTISFADNSSVPTYIYVDNIINSQAVYSGKYSFNSTATQK